MVKSLDPKLVTLVEQDVNTNTIPFLPRFIEAYNYYYAVYQSLDVTPPEGKPGQDQRREVVSRYGHCQCSGKRGRGQDRMVQGCRKVESKDDDGWIRATLNGHDHDGHIREHCI
ncbi:Scarecrow-like protein 1 [Linum perenne]